MAYEVKYRISYKRQSNSLTTIDILDSAGSASVTELTGTSNPLSINFNGNVDSIYDATIGSGATINFYSTPLTLLGLFTTDPQKFMVKCYNGTTGNNLFWQGFVNTGIYSEDYSVSSELQTPITLYCNDGMTILEDLPYTNAGANYTGLVTLSTLMGVIMGKVGLTFTAVRTSSDLMVTGDNTNLFDSITVNNDNYYNESSEPMTCRGVLDSIFGSLGLIVTFKAGVVYIIDPINLHTVGLGYTYGTSPYGETETQLDLGGYLDISADEINWYQTSHTLDVVQPYNQIDIKYDPYNFVSDIYSFNKTNATGTTHTSLSDNSINYDWYTGVTMDGWVISGEESQLEIEKGFNAIQETGLSTLEDPLYFICQKPDVEVGGTPYFTYTFPLSNIKQDDNLMLELNFDVYINTKHDTNIISPAEAELIINTLYIDDIEIKIGNKWWNGASWQDSVAHPSILIRELDAKVEEIYKHKTWFTRRRYLRTEDLSRIDDRWTTVMLYMPISDAAVTGAGLLNGSISIKIPKVMTAFGSGDITPAVTSGYDTFDLIENILYKNFSISVVDTDKIVISNDGVLTNASITGAASMRKTPLEIKLTNSCGTYGVSRGSFSSVESTPIGTNLVGLYRVGDATVLDNTKLLSQSLLGQYGTPRFKLNGALVITDCLIDTQYKLIKDSDYLGTRAFYMIGGTYFDRDEYIQAELIEITDTRQTI